MRRLLAGFGLSLLAVAVLVALISVLPSNPYQPVDGAQTFDRALLCPITDDACSPGTTPQPVSLPHHMRLPPEAGIYRMRFAIDFDRTGDDTEVTGIYLPEFADAISVAVNGVRLTPEPWNPGGERNFHRWHRPFLAMVPDSVLKPTGNRVAIDLAAYSYQDISLFPVQIGAAAPLEFAFQMHLILRVGAARVNFSLMILASGALLAFWLLHSRKPEYLWLGLSSLASAVVCYHWVYPNLFLDYRVWLTLWNTAGALQVWCLLSYVSALLGAELRRFRLVTLGLILAGPVVLALLPVPAFRAGLAVYQAGFLGLSLCVLAVLLAYRSASQRVNVAVLFGLIALAVALAVTVWMLRHVAPGLAPTVVASGIPASLFLSLLWVLFYQLGRSISQYEDLTAALQSTIADKTAELQATYDRLGAQAKLQAIDEERQRILLDLHDGVGGQLVNMLAYMSAQPEPDSVLQTAIEDALRDMGLMIDSIEAGDSIATQLGLLRGRLEPLFRKHHVDLAWKIEADPRFPGAGPSQNLTLLRIVQEAITNAVRHAGAGTITIAATRHSISVVDDGTGFDPVAVSLRDRNGLGLTSMKRRAEGIGAALEVASSPRGTRVVLSWDGTT